MAGIFINYRSADAVYAADLIDRALVAEFGADQVFLDSRSLTPGIDFPPDLLHRLADCVVLLALIGPNWLDPRLADPADYVRWEIGYALAHDKRVIPVLVGGAGLPRGDQLPASIRGLATRQVLEVRGRYAEADTKALVAELARLVPRPNGGAAPPGGGRTHVDNGGASIGQQFNTDQMHHPVFNFGPAPTDHWRDGVSLFRQGSYPEAAAHFRQYLAGRENAPEAHYYLALALLAGRPPRQHADVADVINHLTRARSLAEARLLWLIVEEDLRPGANDAAQESVVIDLVGMLQHGKAAEITGQFTSRHSMTWQLLAQRAAYDRENR